ncbi:MMS ZWEI homologue 3, partial [Striga asiatica]
MKRVTDEMLRGGNSHETVELGLSPSCVLKIQKGCITMAVSIEFSRFRITRLSVEGVSKAIYLEILGCSRNLNVMKRELGMVRCSVADYLEKTPSVRFHSPISMTCANHETGV